MREVKYHTVRVAGTVQEACKLVETDLTKLARSPKKISDLDKNALEEAIRFKEKLGGVEIFTLTVVPEDAKTVL